MELGAGSYQIGNNGNFVLFRGGVEYTAHVVDRLLLGSNDEAYAWIRQPEGTTYPPKWSDMDLAGRWTCTKLQSSGDALVKFNDGCGTHFIVPKDAVRSRPSTRDLELLQRLARCP
jgi:hypothetical protein